MALSGVLLFMDLNSGKIGNIGVKIVQPERYKLHALFKMNIYSPQNRSKTSNNTIPKRELFFNFIACKCTF